MQVIQQTDSCPLEDHPKFYLVSKANSRAFGAGHLDLAIVGHIAAVGLVFDQIMRLDDLTLQVPAAAPSGSSSTVAVTFTSSSIRSSEALYGARGSIEVTNVTISAMTRALSKLS
jgi:hypothetical protein